jgi:threonine/homoserine efflux transporter RhtA
MANTFKNQFSKSVGTSAATIYTTPSSTQTTIIGMTIGNIISSPITVDVYVTSSATDYYLVKGATVPVCGSLVPIGGEQKLVLEAADVLKVVSSAATSADVIVSLLEIT